MSKSSMYIDALRPDGEFELMSYRLNTHVKPLIWVEAVLLTKLAKPGLSLSSRKSEVIKWYTWEVEKDEVC